MWPQTRPALGPARPAEPRRHQSTAAALASAAPAPCINGTPTRSCLLPVSGAANLDITTIEGLDARGEHPLQRAWTELDVPQCGYCQAGRS